MFLKRKEKIIFKMWGEKQRKKRKHSQKTNKQGFSNPDWRFWKFPKCFKFLLAVLKFYPVGSNSKHFYSNDPQI